MFLTRFKNKKLIFSFGLIAAVLCLLASGNLAARKASADANDIMCGGFNSPADFIKKVEANDDGCGHHDIKAIYAYSAYGLEPSRYDAFAKTAKQGYAFKNGNIMVGGRVVATNANTIGRIASLQGAGYYTHNINGHDYYGNDNAHAFASDSLPITVLFNDSGVPVFAVLNKCGNPSNFTPVKPSYSCNNLQLSKVDDQTYSVTTAASAGNGAMIDHVVYNFGDGTTVSKNNPSEAVQHHYASAGNYQVKVTVYVNLPGGGSDSVSSGDCVKTVSIAKANYACVQLVGAILDRGANSYKLTVTASYGNGATPVSADFNFGDGQSQNGVKLAGQTVSVNHTYPSMNKVYSAVAVVHFMAGSQAVSATSNGCRTSIPVTIPYCQALTGTIIDAQAYRAQFTATAVLNGRVLSSADFNFGDGQVQNGVKPTSSTTVVVTHDYSGGGTYDALATLHFTYAGQTYTAPTCRAVVSPTTITPECKPGVPVGDVRCQVCQYDSSLPPDSAQCQPPCTDTGDTTSGATPCSTATTTSLPNTGAGNTIAIFSAVVVAGFVLYRHLLYRRHKAAFEAAEYGSSALPLADPTAPTDPLRGTPLEPSKRRSFRRRQF